MFNHSLEHVFEPARSLLGAAKVLKANGSLVVRIPVVNYAWDYYREYWVGLDAPRHLAIPTERGMQRLAQRCGFRIGAVRYDSDESQFEVSERYQRGQTIAGQSFSHPAVMIGRKVLNIPRMIRAERLNATGRGDRAAFVLKSA
jgi:predicted SAM-dependent methyltransferase